MIYLIAYSLVCILIVLVVEFGRHQTSERFLMADRKIGGILGAFAVAASWIWAPALFVSTQVGYKWGYSGLFWFVIPNMLALMFFAPVANQVRRRLPNGFSYIQFIRNKNGHFRPVQLTVHMIVQVLCCAIQLTAGAELLTFVSGAPYLGIITVMAIAPLCYCLISGLVSSILTDCIQYVVIVVSIATIYIYCPLTHSLPTVIVDSSFHPFAPKMLMQFGLASALTLIFGIFSNHQQWQRAFAADSSQVVQTFSIAGFLHGVVTFGLGTLGVMLANSGYVTHHLQIVGAEYIANHMAPVFSSVFLCMALSGLCATMSSALCAFGALYATEISVNEDPIKASRKAMLALSAMAFAVAIFRVPVIVLWMFCGLIRIGTAAPTIVSVFVDDFSGKRGTTAIAVSILVSAPLFVYGSLTDSNVVRTIGMVLCLLTSAGISMLNVNRHRTARDGGRSATSYNLQVIHREKGMRRFLIFAICVLLGLSGNGAAAAETNKQLTPVTIAQFGHVFLYLPLYVAVDRGFFEKEGLKVKLVSTGGDEKTFTAVSSGNAQFGVSDPTFAAIAREHGQGGKVVACIVRGVPFWVITFDRSIKPISSVEQFKGHKIATYTAPSTSYAVMKSILQNSGRRVDATIVQGGFGTLLALMKANHADMALEIEPIVSIALHQGAKVIYSPAGKLGEFAFTGLTVSDDYFAKHPAEIQSAVNALAAAMAYIHNNFDAALAVAVKEFPEVPKPVLTEALKRLLAEGTVPKTPFLSKEGWSRAIALRKELGDMKSQGTYEQNVDMKFVKRAGH